MVWVTHPNLVQYICLVQVFSSVISDFLRNAYISFDITLLTVSHPVDMLNPHPTHPSEVSWMGSGGHRFGCGGHHEFVPLSGTNS